jgi:adenosylcobinamide-GDP ribazoletransferase
MRGLITAIRTLTVLPVPGKDATRFASSLVFFPIVGGLIGLCVCGVTMLGVRILPWSAGVLGAVAAALLTRGLHVDGLADVADALGGGRTVERRLAIMKDPHVGAFGVMAIVGDFLLKATALDGLSRHMSWGWMIVPFIVSRTALVGLSVALPYARREGGTAESFVREAEAGHLVSAVLIGALLCFIAAGPWSLLALAAGLLLATLLGLWMRRAFGGITGDLLGMANEIIEVALLLALAAALYTASESGLT